ncbi:NUDIX hydrolase [Deinococcus sp.]|uniref:NUDIX hydrolase n=1 Tax=Deinococcus sp. TaxID=47478 RepID=UPI003B5A942B
MPSPALIADELRSLALSGLTYAQDAYDLERYRRLLTLSAELAAQASGAPLAQVRSAYLKNLAHLSPLLGAEAVVVRGAKVLLIRRADSGLWALPGGLAEVGETPAGAAERELFEETGLTGKATRLLAALDLRFTGAVVGVHLIALVFAVEAAGEPHPTLEAREVAWHAWDALPPLHPGHARSLEVARAALKTGQPYSEPEPPRTLEAQQNAAGTPRKPKKTLSVHLTRLLVRLSGFALLRGR